MEIDRQTPEPEEEPVIVAGNNDAVREHLLGLWKEGKSGMQGFIVDDEIEVWNINGSKASMVMKIRKMDSQNLVADWERTRDVKFEF